MGLKTCTITQDKLATSKHCRLDQKYSSFTSVDDWIVFDSEFEQVKLSKLLDELHIVKFKKGELEDEYFLINISDQEQRCGELENVERTNVIGSDKNYLGDADIFVSKLGMPKGYIFLNTYKDKDVLGSTEFIPYKIKYPDSKLLIKYFLLHPKMLTAYSFLESGKTPSHRRVNPYEFLKIKVPLLPKENQDRIVAQIKPIEQKIKELKSLLKEPQTIINKVFTRVFEFDIGQFENLKKEKVSCLEFSRFGNNKDLRNSVKFHRKAGQFVLDELKSRTSKKIKDFISEPIVLGKGISPAQYDDDDGEYYYLSMATIKKWKFERENARLVLDKFAKDNKKKTVQLDDIILARSGEGTIGKVAIIDEKELLGVFADFTMRIRLQEYMCLFAYYYFRTVYFQYLIEINKKGLGNNTNIFPSQIQEFPLLEISLDEQQKIVNEIKAELDAQDGIKVDIDKERNRIDTIIDDEIKNS